MAKAKAKANVGPLPIPPAPVARQAHLVLDGPLGVGRPEGEARVAEIMDSLVFSRVSEAIRDGLLSLDLSALNIPETPTGLPLWTSVLNLSNNWLRVDALPLLHSGVLPTLRALSLSGCALVGELPPAIGALAQTLEELDLSRNRITALPLYLSAPLRALHVLSLAKNALRSLPADLFSQTGCGVALTRLDLRGNELVALPDCVCACARLEVLILSENLIKALPESIGSLRSLRLLDVAHNALTDLSADLMHCEALETLDVTHNNISTLSEAIVVGGTKKLRELRASNNILSAAPDALCGLRALRVLALAGNAIGSLPASIGECEALEEVYLAGNATLAELPESASGWTALRILDARCTKLKALPSGADKWAKTLTYLDATGKKKNTLKITEEQARSFTMAKIVGATVVKTKAKKAAKAK